MTCNWQKVPHSQNTWNQAMQISYLLSYLILVVNVVSYKCYVNNNKLILSLTDFDYVNNNQNLNKIVYWLNSLHSLNE